MNIRRTILVSALSFLGLLASAQDNQDKGRLELGIGMGDQMFERICWHKQTQPFGLLPESEVLEVRDKYRYTQHWFTTASYRLGKVVSVGGMVDVSGVSWRVRGYNGQGDLQCFYGKDYFMNLVVMPDISFSYMNKKYVSLHTAFGAGLGVNTGTETDFLGKKTEFAPAFYVNPIGIKGTYKRFYSSFDLGAMFSLRSSSQIYMFGSRLLSLSIGVVL